MKTIMPATIQFLPGNIFASGCEAIVCPVNTVRTLGAGLAKKFDAKFPKQSQAYYDACDKGLQIGQVVVADTGRIAPRYVLYVPTKAHWLNPSRLDYVKRACEGLHKTCQELEIQSLAVPALGCGLGDLEWKDVKPELATLLGAAPRVLIYEPK